MNFRFSRALPPRGLSLAPGREAFHPMDAAGPHYLICPGRAGPLICLCRAGDACVVGALERVGDTLYGAWVYVELGRRLAHAHAARQSCSDSLSQLVRDRWPAESFTFTLGPLKASAHALLNYRAFELAKNADHLKHRLACWRGRIETLLMQKQVDAERVKLGQERHKVFQAAPQAIDVPRHHDVELALGGVPAQCIECRSSIAALRAADAMISVDLRHLPVGPLCRLAYLVLL